MITEFETQDTLHPDIFDGNSIKPNLRLGLLKIGKFFYKFLDINAHIIDITLTGSSVNYNWHDKSDIDLHIIIDYSEIDDNLELVSELMMSKKSIWNTTYPLEYKGMQIELYAQDNEETHTSTGVYSILRDKWLIEPSAEKVSVDDDIIKDKAKSYKDEIDMIKTSDPAAIIKIRNIKRKIKRLRHSGLRTGGEYSIENLAFKELRNSGYLKKLSDLQHDITMNQLKVTENG